MTTNPSPMTNRRKKNWDGTIEQKDKDFDRKELDDPTYTVEPSSETDE